MRLTQYMADKKLDDETFAALFGGGCSIFAVRKWRRGERRPRVEHMLRIAEITDNAVTPNDFAGLIAPENGEAA